MIHLTARFNQWARPFKGRPKGKGESGQAIGQSPPDARTFRRKTLSSTAMSEGVKFGSASNNSPASNGEIMMARKNQPSGDRWRVFAATMTTMARKSHAKGTSNMGRIQPDGADQFKVPPIGGTFGKMPIGILKVAGSYLRKGPGWSVAIFDSCQMALSTDSIAV